MGAMAVAFVSGAQNHVLTSPKHFALNNQENTRFEMSANVDERTLHEIYLPHFRRCVEEAAAGSIMSAYNKVNGVYCGEHRELLIDILRGLWGFRGFVESDWFLGTRSTAEALKGGLDIEMPAPYRWTADKLMAALDAVDRAAGNALYQKVAWNLNELPVPDESVVECDAHVALAREAAERSLVLLKNEAGVLPLRDVPGLRLAVVGDLADQVNLGDRGSSLVTPSAATSPLAGIRALVRRGQVDYFPSNADLSALGDYGAVVVVTGLTYREEGEFIPTAQQEAEQDELARGGDRTDLQLPAREIDLLARVTAAGARPVVVLEGGSAIEVDAWLDDVAALVMAWYPGREGGHAIARMLLGEVNPSGRLPVSFPRSMRQLMDWDVTALDVRHDLLHGYRYLDDRGEAPRFAFGFGLSYSTFELVDFAVRRADGGFVLDATVRNTGDRAGATVVQLYVSATDSQVFRASKELKHFGRVELAPAESATVRFELDDAALSFYDPDARGWRLEDCAYRFLAGFSAVDLPRSETWRRRDGSWSADA
jgi:beta-glucosidase